jgi:RNA polymerase sigma factor (sigma-70 family)
MTPDPVDPTRRTPLTADEEVRLAKRVEAGLLAAAMLDPDDPTEPVAPAAELRALVAEGEQAKTVLLCSCLRLVSWIARESAPYTDVPWADLYQEGCLGLGKALLSFDYRRGRFADFAGQAIRRHIRRLARRARDQAAPAAWADERVPFDPDHTHEALVRLLRALPRPERRVLALRHGWDGAGPATLSEVARALGYSMATVRRLERQGLERLRREWFRDVP